MFQPLHCKWYTFYYCPPYSILIQVSDLLNAKTTLRQVKIIIIKSQKSDANVNVFSC